MATRILTRKRSVGMVHVELHSSEVELKTWPMMMQITNIVIRIHLSFMARRLLSHNHPYDRTVRCSFERIVVTAEPRVCL